MNLVTFLRLQWDRVGSWAAIAAGAVTLLLGYLGISNTPHVAAQLPYIISGGLFGIFLLGVGGMLWLSADLRDEWREVRAMREAVDRAVATPPRAVEVVPELELAPPAVASNGRARNGTTRRRRPASELR